MQTMRLPGWLSSILFMAAYPLSAFAISACAPAVQSANSRATVSNPPAAQGRSVLVSMPADSTMAAGFVVRAFRADGSVDSTITLPATFAAWSPDGRSIAYVDMELATRSRLNIRGSSGRVDTVRLAPLLAEQETPYSTLPMWSPTGDAVGVLLSALATSRRVTYEFVVLDVGTLTIRRRYPIPEAFNEIFRSGGVPDQAAWSPDGKAVFLSWGGRMVVVDLGTGVLHAVPERVAAAAWSPDGRAIYFLSSRSGYGTGITGFFMHLLTTRNSLRLADSAAIAVTGMRQFRWLTSASMELSPSGRMLAIGAGAGDSSAVYIYNTTQSSPIDVTKPATVVKLGGQLPVRLDWSPDDRQIAVLMVGVPRYSVQTIDVQSGTVRMLVRIPLANDAIDFVGMMKLLSWGR